MFSGLCTSSNSHAPAPSEEKLTEKLTNMILGVEPTKLAMASHLGARQAPGGHTCVR